MPETLQGLHIACPLFGEKLQSNGTAQIQVLSLIDNTHAPAAQLFDDAVVRDGLAKHRRNAMAWGFASQCRLARWGANQRAMRQTAIWVMVLTYFRYSRSHGQTKFQSS